MKKLLTIIALMLVLVCALTACKKDEEEPTDKKDNNHSFGEWKLYNEDETNCENKIYFRTCLDCSQIEWKEGKYDDHKFETVTTKPTCQAGGYDTKTCTLCGKVEITNETPITDHKFETVTTKPTCQAGGYDTKTCTLCGKVVVTNETPIADHSYVEEYLTDNSFHWQKCENCDHTTTKVEHTLGDDGICTACDAVVGETEGLIYELSDDGTYATLIAYEGTETRIKIADTYQDVPVTEIYERVFFENRSITSVIIPDSVTTIGAYAFSSCSSLTSVVIPDSVTTIGAHAFSVCSRLTSVVIPDSVTTIDYRAFSTCSSLTSVVIGDSVTTIGKEAFAYCSSLTGVVIPDSVTTIGRSAFYSCSSLTGVVIDDSVTSIGEDAFSGCNSALYSEYEYGKYVGSSDNPYAVLIEITNKNLSTYKIHEDTRIIAYGVFKSCSHLSNITIPDSVTTIGEDAFYLCDNLTGVYITDIAAWCNITFSKSYSNPLLYAKKLYLNNELVTELVIPDGITTINDYAFYRCSSLTSVVIPDSVTTIGDYAFYYCSSLTGVVIPDSVTTIGNSAFYYCSSLTDVYYTGSEAQWAAISIIGYYNSAITYATRHYNYMPEEN